MSAEAGPLQARSRRVWVAPVREQDIAPYRLAVEQSRKRLGRWNPVDPDDLAAHLTRQSSSHRTFVIHPLEPEGDHDIVGRVNVTNVVRGRFESAAMGYDAYDPYAGRGLFAEGLRLVVDLAFAPESAGGMGLHRVSAPVQPGNVRSAGLLRALGFQREGLSPRMLRLPGEDGEDTWRDHVSYAVVRETWPAEPYAPPRAGKVVVLVNAKPGPRRSALARELSAELGIPRFSEDVLSGKALWGLLSDSPIGGVVEGDFSSDDAQFVIEGLIRSGVDPTGVSEVCWLRAHEGGVSRPLGLGETVAVDPGEDVGRRNIVRIALQTSSQPLQGFPKG